MENKETKILVGEEIDTVYCALQVTITDYEKCVRRSVPNEAEMFQRQIEEMKKIQEKLR